MTAAATRRDVEQLAQMLLVRRFEERCIESYSAAKIRGFMHTYIGEEAVGTGVMAALRPGDAVVSNYREHGHALLRGISPGAVMAEMYGKQEGCSRGRGGSMHLFDAKTNFYGGNAIVAGGIPVALGLALAQMLRKQPDLTCCIFGDGAVAEGEFHESMNLAALWKLPVLFICENNLYAMGTRLERYESNVDLSAKAASYGMPAQSADGMDVEAVETAALAAAQAVRGGGGPYFLECKTYRFRAHSMYDPELYRDRAEVEQWKHRDPIETHLAKLKERGAIAGDDVARIEREIAATIAAAIDFAESGTLEPVEDLTRFVYSERAK